MLQLSIISTHRSIYNHICTFFFLFQIIDGKNFIVSGHMTNVMGYESFLGFDGTLIDLTPPDPGDVGNVTRDEIIHEGCEASILQRCYDLTTAPNHRYALVQHSGIHV